MTRHSSVAGQGENFGNSKAGINNSLGNGSGSATKESAATSSALARRATGPRTRLGKERSSRNSLKHGIFSEVVLLKFEKPNQFKALLQGFRRAWKPEGMFEETLVENLAVNQWQQRRLLQAENGCLAKNVEEAESERSNELDNRTNSRIYMELESELDTIVAIADKRGLIPLIADPEYLEPCLDTLGEVRSKAKNCGFNDESIPKLLRRVYGARYEGRPGKDLFDVFRCLDRSRAASIEHDMTHAKSEIDYSALFLTEVDKEIARLERMRKYPVSRQFFDSPDDYYVRIFGPELMRLMVPSDSDLDRLLRYRAYLERSFDRTQSQLERVQRMRLGQPVLPTVEVRHSRP
jgi:hypothetical protein